MTADANRSGSRKQARPHQAKNTPAKGKFQTPRTESGQAAGGQKTSASRPVKGENRGCAAPKKKKKGKGGLIAAVCAAAVLILAVGGIFVYDRISDDGLILDNVYAAGINIGNMSKEEAAAALSSAAEAYTAEKLTVNLPDCSLVLTPEQTKAALDVGALVEDAWNYGREGGVFARARARADAELGDHTISLEPYLVLDKTFVEDLVNQFAADVASTLTEPKVEVTGQRPELDAQAPAEGQTLVITMGTAERSIDAQALYSRILDAYNRGDFTPIEISYTEKLPEKPDLKKAFEQYNTPAVDAVLDPETYEVTPEVDGYGFDLEEAQKQVDAAEEGQVIEIKFAVLPAAVTAESLEANLFKDVLGQCSTEYSNIPDRTHNLILACEAIDGYIVGPGEVFSFNEVVGERTEEKGYRAAIIYSGGLSVPGLGGGVCQVATTIYCCTLYADLEIVERTCHQFVVDYVPHRGMDATIYWGYLDFKFRNNTDYPIRIDADVSNGCVNVTLMGKDTKSYTVDIISETTESYSWEVEYKKVTPEEAARQGYYDGEVLVQPYTGYKVQTYKVFTDKETGKTWTEWEAQSIFDSRNKVIVDIIEPEPKPTEPPATKPPETEPPETEPPETEPPASEAPAAE